MNGDYRPGDQRRPRHRGRNQNRRRHHDRPRQDAPAPAPKQNPIIAFFARLFGLGKSAPAQRPARPERRDEEMRPRNDRRPRNEDRRDRPQEAGRPGGQPQPRRPLPAADITTPRLYVGNLSYDAGDSDLFDLFSQSGTVRNVEIARDRDNHRSKGFGFVEMESVEAAKAAHAKFNGYEMLGRALVISGAKPAPERRSRPQSSEGEVPAEVQPPSDPAPQPAAEQPAVPEENRQA